MIEFIDVPILDADHHRAVQFLKAGKATRIVIPGKDHRTTLQTRLSAIRRFRGDLRDDARAFPERPFEVLHRNIRASPFWEGSVADVVATTDETARSGLVTLQAVQPARDIAPAPVWSPAICLDC